MPVYTTQIQHPLTPTPFIATYGLAPLGAKPFVEEELRIRIDNLLRNYRERMELFSKNGGNQEDKTEKSHPVSLVAVVLDRLP